jgi:hypothetical protein
VLRALEALMGFMIVLALLSFPYGWFRLGLAVKRLVTGRMEANSGLKSLMALLWLVLLILALPLSVVFVFALPFGAPIVLVLQLIWLTLFEISLHYGFTKSS